jgi:glutathione S-transferase
VYTLYEMADSGNCYKVRLLMNQLDIEYQRVATDILHGESRTGKFLALNPNGKVPLLILPNGQPLAESNAILCFLALGSPLTPEDGYQQALTLQWLFFEQYSHEPFIATNRFWIHIENSADQHAAEIAANHSKGLAALEVMNRHLESHQYFTGGDFYGIADIALYAYSHVAHQGNYDLSGFTAVNDWLARVEKQLGHIPISA